MKTLIVDDDHIMRRMVRKAAMSLGHEATGCADAEKALEILKEERFALIVLDWMLPGMDGVELCKNIRGLPGGQRCFIIMVTAKNSHEDLLAVLDAGANDYIAKPVDMKTLKTRRTVAERIISNMEDKNNNSQ